MGKTVPWRYPAAGLLGGVLLSVVYIKFRQPGLVAFYGLLMGILIAATLTDLGCRVIPNRLLAAGLAGGALLFPWARPMPGRQALAGLLVCGTAMFVLAVASRGGIGGGDVKLAAVAGFFLGPWPALLALFLSFVAGGAAGAFLLISGRKGPKDTVPFGPYIALGSVIALFWGWPILEGGDPFRCC